MSIRTDPLEKAPSFADRVYYATGVLLDAHDFGAEQLYHRNRLARALAYLHGSGTVAGLKVVWESPLDPGDDPDFPQGREERIVVQSGIAVDRLGRIIEVPRCACLRLAQWYEGQEVDDLRTGWHGAPFSGVVADVFVRFVTCERGKTPAFAAGPFDALDAVTPSRLRDSYELTLVVRKEAAPPLPQSPWPDLAAIASADGEEAAHAALHEAVFGAWREGTDWWNLDGPVPLPEHTSGQDTTAVFLARLVVPATQGATDEDPPERTPGEAVQVDNDSRAFVYTANALARWLGL